MTMGCGDILTERERTLLAAIAWHANGQASARRIAWRLGYRPSQKGILPVVSMCRALNRKFPSKESGGHFNCGRYIVRVGAQDQWDTALWCVTSEARGLLSIVGELTPGGDGT